jgi:predicted alpha/beta superfamily hydrolase
MMGFTTGQVYFFSTAGQPILQLFHGANPVPQNYRFIRSGPGRWPSETLWLAEPAVPLGQAWRFRLKLANDGVDTPASTPYYTTKLRTVWFQEGQIYGYCPPPLVSSSRVEKIEKLSGSMSSRALYIYLPRGYDDQPDRRYPVLYMHDGQNCFAAFVEDSYAGSWRADEVADQLIGQGLMQECIIVGVSHGQAERLVEYLPPYITRRERLSPLTEKIEQGNTALDWPPLTGQADRLAAYYRYEVAPFLSKLYRIQPGRDYTATCGSSMGGLFSIYLAWEYTAFARHHAALSPSFWISETAPGRLESIERLRQPPRRDIRLWLDSGTRDEPDQGDDGWRETRAAYQALLENGYQAGPDFRYYLDKGATHSEAAWAARLPLVFQFLFPI